METLWTCEKQKQRTQNYETDYRISANHRMRPCVADAICSSVAAEVP